MKSLQKSDSVLQHNFLQLLFVFAAFALMALAAYFFIGRFLREHLLVGAEELLASAEANVKAGLSEAETTLLNSYYIVQNMVERDADKEEILDYLTVNTEWMRQRNQGLLELYGVYGYIRGEFYDSIGMNPGSDYIPQTRPWYQTAVRSGNTVGYTSPYIDWHSGDAIFSVVRNIDLKNGDIAGIIAVDVNVNWLTEYVGSLALAEGGYGILLSQNMTIMTCPDRNFVGRHLQDLGGAYEGIARTLRAGKNISAHQIIDLDGNSAIVFFRRISNNWYVGIVTPYYRFFRDLYASAMILAGLGILLSLLLCLILLRLSAAKMRADEESKAKSSFLANMSHEIRTPMNAVIGMAELLLRGELSNEARSHVQDIKQAGHNLISIINDILDFSKIEAGRLEINITRYMLSSLVNDTVNIILMRLGEKPIKFFTSIDGNIPDGLFGDEVRIRQILINLLSNAVKYSEKGHIHLSITEEKRVEKLIWIKIKVTDTGKGIKPEDKAKLFGDFVQLDMIKNRSIEGTGLGLAITKRLCVAMRGDISVESEYGSGSTFTVIVPQAIESDTPIAMVEGAEQKSVLVFENRPIYEKSLAWSLDNLRISHTIATNADNFSEALFRKEWSYVFVSHSLYETIKPEMGKDEKTFPGGQKPPLAVMAERGDETYIPNVRYLFLPVQSLSIANILNGKADTKSYTDGFNLSDEILFTFNRARILVVDDLPTNLKVAEGLLAPYRGSVTTCLSGIEAIELIKKEIFDIVFMDHMMPGMDGVEATVAIRAWEKGQNEKKSANVRKNIPIIALTANAVIGVREMFLEKGFNDFLSKPIDVSKLEEILDRWIPDEKKTWEPEIVEQDSKQLPQSFIIPGIDVAKGITMTGGTIDGYCRVLSLFRRDTEARLPLLQTMPASGAMPEFITQVHALKSASASIGAADVPTGAAALEAAGRAGDLALIGKQLPDFAKQVTELVNKIAAWEISAAEIPQEDRKQPEAQDPGNTLILLRELSDALKLQKAGEIDDILGKLKRQTEDTSPDSALGIMLKKISGEVLIAEYGNAAEILEEFLKEENNS